jgi:hypothetical protein
MLCEGLTQEAITVVADTRRRHDGRTRNPFNETEAGNHYIRSLSAWGLIPALSGFRYSAVSGELVIAGDKAGTYPWTTGYGWGLYTVMLGPDSAQLQLTVAEGKIVLERITVSGVGQLQLSEPRELVAGSTPRFDVLRVT